MKSIFKKPLAKLGAILAFACGSVLVSCSSNDESDRIFNDIPGVFDEYVLDGETNSSIGTGTAGLAYYIDTTNSTALVGIGSATAKSIVVPGKYNTDYTVIGIKDSGFANSSITSISFETPADVTTIGYQAFSDSKLTAFICPIAVTSIYGSAFQNCLDLVSFKFDSGTTALTLLGDHAFAGDKAFKYFTSPTTTGAWTIGDSAFEACVALESAILRGGLTTVGESAFEGCETLGLIYLPASIDNSTDIGNYAFKGCYKAIGYISGESLPTGFSTNGIWNYVDDSTGASSSTEYVVFTSKTGELNYSSGFIYVQSEDDASTTNYDIVIISYIGSNSTENEKGSVDLIIPPTITDNDGVHKIVGIDTYAFSSHTELGTLGFGAAGDPSFIKFIGDHAFYNCGQFTSIDFSHCTSLTKLDNYCFYTDNNNSQGSLNIYWLNFTTLTIPKSVVTIGDYAFTFMKNSSSLIFEGADDGTSNLQSIGVQAFRGFGSQIYLKPGSTGFDLSGSYTKRATADIVFPSTLSTVGQQAFYYASFIRSITFKTAAGTSLVIGNQSFCELWYLESLTLPEDATSVTIKDAAFSIRSQDSSWWYNAPSELHSVYIPSNVTTIGSNPFQFRPRLTIYCEVALVGSATKPSGWGYYWNQCTTSTYYFGESSTDGPRGLDYYTTYWNVGTATGQNHLLTYSNASYGKYDFLSNGDAATCTLTSYYYRSYEAVGGSNPVVPSTVSINSADCSVTAIGDQAFMWSCSNTNSQWSVLDSNATPLKTLTLPDSIASIGVNCFAGTRTLTQIKDATDFTFPTSLTTISKNAFCYTGLTQVLLPTGITTMSMDYYGPFIGCFNLSVIKIGNDSTASGQTFYSYQNNIYQAGTNNYSTMYTCAEGASTFGDDTTTTCTVPMGCSSIGSGALRGQRKMAGLKLPYTLTSIPSKFIDSINDSDAKDSSGSYGYNSLTSVRFYTDNTTDYPNSLLTEIGAYAFDSSHLVTMELPTSLERIDDCAFAGCSKLKFFPNDSTSAGTEGLLDLSTLTNLESVGQYAFTNSKITELTLSPRLTSVSYCCFWSNTSLATINFQEGLTDIGGYAFQYNSSLTTLSMPASLTTLGVGAFSGDTGITSFTITGTALTTIDERTFSGNNNMAALDLNAKNLTSALSVGVKAFESCSALTSLVLPADVSVNSSATGTNSAFYGCSGLVGDGTVGSTTGLFLLMTGTEYSATNTSGAYVNLPTTGWNYYSGETPVTYAFYAATEADKVCARDSSAKYWRYVNDVPTIW